MITASTSLIFAASVLGAAAVTVLVYDLVVYLRFGRTATISHAVWVASLRYPIVPYAFVATTAFVAGFLACHFFGFDR